MSTGQEQAARTRSMVRGLSDEQREAFDTTRTALGSYKQSQKAMEKIARAVVSLRLTFEKGGKPDFGGESPKYREIVTGLYEQIITDDEERTLFKSAIRYWIRKEFDQRIDAGTIKRSDLGERFTNASRTPAAQPADGSDGDGDDEDSDQGPARGNQPDGEGKRMDDILAELAPRTAIRAAGNALAANVDVVGVIPTIKAIHVALEAVDKQMGEGFDKTPALERAVKALVDRTIMIADRAEVSVLEEVVRHDRTAATA